MTSFSKIFELRRCQPWLGTFVEVSATGRGAERVTRGVQAAFEAVQRVHQLMSFHDPDSEVTLLNQRAARVPVVVHAWTYQVLHEARRLHLLSDGVFDIAIAPSLMTWGFLPQARPLARYDGTTADIELMSGQQVRFHRPLAMDLGGIAKGFAVDRAIEALQGAGAFSGSVNAGGDLRVFGPDPQPLRIRQPGQPERTIPSGEMVNEAAATSSTCFSLRRRQGRWVSPIVNAHTGRPWLGRASVTVLAPTCLWADALTKIVALAPQRAPEILAQCHARAVIISNMKRFPSRVVALEFSPCTLAA